MASTSPVESKSIPKAIHRSAMNHAIEILNSGKCKHIYIDLGSNRGVQFRKLYQPAHYPKSTLVHQGIWDKYFGSMALNNRTDVCSFGFEPNPIHNTRLKSVQREYTRRGVSIVIFRETAAWTENGNTTFFHDIHSKPISHEVGGTIMSHGRSNQKEKYDVMTFDIGDFMKNQILKRSGIDKDSTIIAKVDIEGAEYFVLPDLFSKGVLCHIDYIYMEWHRTSGSFGQQQESIEKELQKNMSTVSPKCKTVISTTDDDAYGSGDEDPLPLPTADENN